MRASILRRIKKLETSFESFDAELLELDSSLLLDSERSYFSREMKILRLKARKLGYGDGPEANIHDVGWFDLGNFDPMINDDVKVECLKALDERERGVMETLREIGLKALHLTEALSEEEKNLIREYNKALRHSSNDHADLRSRYKQVMTKHGEKVFE